MVAPIALAKLGIGLAVRRAHRPCRKAFCFLLAHAPVLCRHGKLSGGKGVGKNSFRLRCLSQKDFSCLIGKGKGAGGDHQRIIAVCLNQIKEGMDIFPSESGRKPHVAPAVLVYVPEIAIALGVILPAQREIVVFPLRVSVLSGIEIEGGFLFPVCEEHGRAAPKKIIQIGLLAVGVEYGIGSLTGCLGAQGFHYQDLFFPLFRRPMGAGGLFRQRRYSAFFLRLAVKAGKPQSFSRPQHGFLWQETAGEQVLGDLGLPAKLGKRMLQKAVGHGKGGVFPENQSGLYNGPQQASRLVPGQAEIAALHLGHDGAVRHGRPHPEIGAACFGVFHLHPGLGKIGFIFQRIMADPIRHQSGHAVQKLQGQGLFPLVSQGEHPAQRRRAFSRHAKIESGGRNLPALTGDLHLAHANVHIALPGKQFLIASVNFTESTKAGTAYVTVGHMGRAEFHNGVILIRYAEAAHRLAPVVVITPDRHAQLAANSWQEAGKGGLFLII